MMRPRAFSRSRSGNVAILSAMTLFAVTGGAALAVDYSQALSAQAELLMVAEAAAMAGASKLPTESTVDAAAIAIADANRKAGVTIADVTASDVELGNYNSTTQAFTVGGTPVNAVRVTARRVSTRGNAVPTTFGGVFGIASLDVQASAIGGGGSSPACMITLAPSGSKALHLDSNADVDLIGCQVIVNSTDSEALYTDSNATMAADKICVAGAHMRKSSSSVTPTAETGCAAVADPYASLPAPSTAGCAYTNREVDNTTTTLNPGVYCGGLKIKNNANVTLSPGTYVIKDSDFLVDSNARLTGSGVTIYMAGSTKLDFDSNSIVNLTAPTSGTYSGILLFSAAANTSEMAIDSNSAGTLTGVIYFPKAKLKVNSNAQLGSASTCTQIVAWQIEFNSNSGLQTDFDMSTCASGVQPGGTGSVSLLH